MGLTPGIARYLLELDDALDASPADRSRALAEVEEHLVDAVDEQLARGLDLPAAETLALQRFGSASDVAAAFHDEAGLRAAPYTLLRRFDAWRTDHIWIGALVPTGLLAGTIALFFIAFAVIARLPLANRQAVATATNAFLVFVTGAFFVGRVLVGYVVRRRPEPHFRSRVRALRHERPFVHSALVQLPPAVGLALAELTLRVDAAFVVVLFVFQLLPLLNVGRCTIPRARPAKVFAQVRAGLPILFLPVIGFTSGTASDARHVAAWVLPPVVMFAGFHLLPRWMGHSHKTWPPAVVMLIGLSLQAALLGFSARGFAALIGFFGLFGLCASLVVRRLRAAPNRSRLAAEAQAASRAS